MALLNKTILLLFIFLISLQTLSHSQEVRIGTYIINAGKFDPQSGSYTVDFYLSMQCEVNCSANFEFANGRSTTVDKITDLPNNKFYRIQANLQNSPDFRKFPFDSQELTIEIEDKTKTKNELEYAINEKETGISKSVSFIGWDLKNWSTRVESIEYPVYDEVYSRYIFSINLQRESLSSLLKVFFPVMLILLLNFFAHFPNPDKVASRITLHTSFIIAAVMFHVAIGNQLPPFRIFDSSR